MSFRRELQLQAVRNFRIILGNYWRIATVNGKGIFKQQKSPAGPGDELLLFWYDGLIDGEGGWYLGNGLMLLAPSAFFLIGIFIWVLRTFKPDQVEKD